MRSIDKDKLRQVRQVIIDNKNRFEYEYYCIRSDCADANTADLMHDCNTVGCVAGFACALFNFNINKYEQIDDKAKEILGLDDAQASYLFLGDSYKDQEDIHLGRATYIDAIDRIDYLLNEVE